MQIRCELIQIRIIETEIQQIIVLKESEGNRIFPIVIGKFEAEAIDRRVKGQMLPRPMTHDLVELVMEGLGGRLLKIIITDLKDHTFYAKLVIRRNGDEILVDSRPSDAIALAAGHDVPIYVEEHVLNEVAGPRNEGE